MQKHHNVQPEDRPITLPWEIQPLAYGTTRPSPWSPVEVAGLDGARLRALRESPFARNLLGGDRFARFWFCDMRRLSLFLILMRESPWLRGEWGCFAMATLASRSKMSIARIYQVLCLGKGTGDFLCHRDSRDGRMILLEPSPAAQQAFEALIAQFFSALSLFLHRIDPLPRLTPEERREAYVDSIDTLHALLGRAALDDRQMGSTSFLVAMLDLWLHSPVPAPDFVRREASRLRVTQATMRNVLHRAERAGLIERSLRMLRLTPAAEQQTAAVVASIMSELSALHARTEARLRHASPADDATATGPARRSAANRLDEPVASVA
ncbi:conserved protein of unknown function [Rhodovastum atsumiense]|uniref:Uncharacterized protein n=1 Tax=Rhodovastum atsumiense TaxID=504468 RepID=A0A5M6J2N8_9PROT|nr:hypothetical protein [Rhodovastum atsumiense]KAA5613885.1 hypothetical protein F1189_03680 [Rhodovastum atsumiense]CAH2602011.1 conserved protein of unknown function [Rhodovastum atsumiense]